MMNVITHGVITSSIWVISNGIPETIGNLAVGAMLLSLSRDEQHANIAKFIQHELDEVKKKLTLLQEQGS